MRPPSLPFPRAVVESGAIAADALISIRPAEQNAHLFPPVAIPEGRFGSVLVLPFDDIPCTSWKDGRTGTVWLGPTETHLANAIAFARGVFAVEPEAFIAVHCEQGKSRSAAVALAVTADRLGSGNEEEAVRLLLENDVEQQRCFNPLLVRLADRLLGRGNAIETALERRCAPFVTWRRYWTRKDALPLYGLPEDRRTPAP